MTEQVAIALISGVASVLGALIAVVGVVLNARINRANERAEELRVRVDALEEWADDVEAHVDDLYQAIGAEPDGGAVIRGRLKTKRPERKR